MKKRLLIFLGIYIVASLLAVSGGMYLYADSRSRMMTQKIKEESFDQLTQAFRLFYATLRIAKRPVDQNIRKNITLLVNEFISGHVEPSTVDESTLSDYCLYYGFDDISFIDSNGTVVNTTMPENLGLNLFSLSPNLGQLLEPLFGTDTIRVGETRFPGLKGPFLISAYAGLPNRSLLLRVSVDLGDHLPPDVRDFLFNRFFQDLKQANPHLRDLDLFTVDQGGQDPLPELPDYPECPVDAFQALEQNTIQESQQADLLTVYIPVPGIAPDKDTPSACVVATLDFSSLKPNPGGVFGYSLGLALVCGGLGSLVAFIFLNRLVLRRILGINTVLAGMASGDYEREARTRGDDEISQTAKHVNHMRQKLLEREAGLKQAMEELESRVEDRTREFIQTNEELEREVADRKLAEEKLTQHQATLEQQVISRTLDLTRSNQRLEREVVERRQAQSQLADLNASLERLVEERTTDLAQKAAELGAANKRLRELDDLKSSFLSVVSHEMRTPLTSVRGYARMIARDFEKYFKPHSRTDKDLLKKSERLRNNVAIIEQEGERLTRLINDVLDLSKIESGRTEWRDTVVQPALVLAKAAQSVSQAFYQKPEVKLKVDLSQDLKEVELDPDRLLQVAINLLQNAIKFTSQGSVTLSARMIDTNRMEIRVADTGIGIPPEDLDKVFDKFHQVSQGDTVTSSHAGTGLGLAISRHIIEHYQGRIWVESKQGQGSTFFFTLPSAPGQ